MKIEGRWCRGRDGINQLGAWCRWGILRTRVCHVSTHVIRPNGPREHHAWCALVSLGPRPAGPVRFYISLRDWCGYPGASDYHGELWPTPLHVLWLPLRRSIACSLTKVLEAHQHLRERLRAAGVLPECCRSNRAEIGAGVLLDTPGSRHDS